jgi:hypothetical protein
MSERVGCAVTCLGSLGTLLALLVAFLAFLSGPLGLVLPIPMPVATVGGVVGTCPVPTRWRRWGGWTLLVGGVVASTLAWIVLITAAVMHFRAMSENSSLQDLRSD